MVVKFQRHTFLVGWECCHVVNNGERMFALTRGFINEREEIPR